MYSYAFTFLLYVLVSCLWYFDLYQELSVSLLNFFVADSTLARQLPIESRTLKVRVVFLSASSGMCRRCQGCSHSSSSSAAQLHVCDMTRLFGCGYDSLPEFSLFAWQSVCQPWVFLSGVSPLISQPRLKHTQIYRVPRHCWHFPLTNGHKCIIG